jgi:hypothetical protein
VQFAYGPLATACGAKPTAVAITTITGDETAGQTSCTGTFNLDGGQITVQGLADNAALFGRGETNPLSIIGGDGIYRNARGDGTIHVPPDVPTRRTRTSSSMCSPASASERILTCEDARR